MSGNKDQTQVKMITKIAKVIYEANSDSNQKTIKDSEN
jgi:hypothetical protein